MPTKFTIQSINKATPKTLIFLFDELLKAKLAFSQWLELDGLTIMCCKILRKIYVYDNNIAYLFFFLYINIHICVEILLNT